MQFYDDDGNEMNPDLLPKPDLCVSCRKDEAGGMEEILCQMNRLDQSDEDTFRCDAYEPKTKEQNDD